MLRLFAYAGGAIVGLAIAFNAPLAAPVAPTAEAAKAEKVELCHWSDNDNQYVEIEIPAKQIAKGKGHARHEHDRLVPAEGCASLPDPEA